MLSLFYNQIKKRRFHHLKKRLKAYGEGNDLSYDIQIDFPDRVTLGSYIYIGPGASINGLGGIEIKSGVIIGPNLTIHSANHNYKTAKFIPYDETFEFRKVTIHENVWIGGNVIITPGSTIGEGAIIGAGCVVSGNIPALAIAIGNPCQVIKYRDQDHYNKLKQDNKIYLKYKFEKNITPNITDGYTDF